MVSILGILISDLKQRQLQLEEHSGGYYSVPKGAVCKLTYITAHGMKSPVTEFGILSDWECF